MNSRCTIVFVLVLFSNSLYNQIDGATSQMPAFDDLMAVRISKRVTLLVEQQPKIDVPHKNVPKNWGFGLEIFSGYNSHTGNLSENYTDYVAVGIAIAIYYKKVTASIRNSFGFNKTKKDFEYYFGHLEKDSRSVSFLSEASLGYVIYTTHRLKVSPFAGIGFIKMNPITRNTAQEIDPKKGLLKSSTFNFGLALDITFSSKNSTYPTVASNSFMRIRYGYGLQRPETNFNGITGNMQYITIGYCANLFW